MFLPPLLGAGSARLLEKADELWDESNSIDSAHIDCNYGVHTELETHALQTMFTFAYADL